MTKYGSRIQTLKNTIIMDKLPEKSMQMLIMHGRTLMVLCMLKNITQMTDFML